MKNLCCVCITSPGVLRTTSSLPVPRCRRPLAPQQLHFSASYAACLVRFICSLFKPVSHDLQGASSILIRVALALVAQALVHRLHLSVSLLSLPCCMLVYSKGGCTFSETRWTGHRTLPWYKRYFSIYSFGYVSEIDWLAFLIAGITTVLLVTGRGSASQMVEDVSGNGTFAGGPCDTQIGDKCAHFVGYVHCTTMGSLIGDCAACVVSNPTSVLDLDFV